MIRYLLILVLLFVGCNPLQQGEIYSKNFKPAWDEEVYSPIKVGDVTIPNWNTVHHPDQYILGVRDNYDEETKKWQTGRVWVSSGDYNEYEIGDWYSAE